MGRRNALKTILVFISLLFLRSLCFADAGFIGEESVTNSISGAAYLIDEDFEGTGTPSGWTTYKEESLGTIDFDYATSPAPLSGSQSLYTESVTYRDVWAIPPDFTASSTLAFKGVIRKTIANTDEAIIIAFRNVSDTVVSQVKAGTASDFNILHGTTNGYGTDNTFLIDTTYYIWVDYTKSSGSDGTLSVYVNTSDSKPGTPAVTTSTGTATDDITSIYLKSDRGMGLIWDDITLQ